MKKRIIIFNGYYYPSKNYGGPITSIENAINACCDEFDFYIVCYNYDFNSKTSFEIETNTWQTVGNAQVLYVPKGYLDYSFRRMKTLFNSVNPDLLWFSGVLTPNYKIVASLCSRKLGIPVLFSPRGELSADRVIIKAYKKIPYLKLIHFLGFYKGCYFHATSADEEEGIVRFFNPSKNHLFRIPNISLAQQVQLEVHNKEKDALKVFFFSRIHEVKNLKFAIQCVCQCRRKIVFDIYGPIESEKYWEECLLEIKSAPNNITIRYGGMLDYSTKTKAIQQHDCFLFPTVNENYGHVIAESLANSRPVILSKNTTPWDDLNGRGGYVIPLNEPVIFTNKLDYLATLDNSAFDELLNETRRYFKEKTEKDNAITEHKNMFLSIMRSWYENIE